MCIKSARVDINWIKKDALNRNTGNQSDAGGLTHRFNGGTYSFIKACGVRLTCSKQSTILSQR